MYGLQIHSEFKTALPVPGSAEEDPNWYAIHTVARHEKRVEQQLRENGVLTFLPLVEQIRKWSDRRARVEVPLFSCYAFVRTMQKAEDRLKVLRIPGVLGFVGSERIGTPIPSEEIENLQMVIREKLPLAVHPFVTVGKRVRIRGGAIDGLEGILEGHAANKSVIVSVELLQRSVSIRVEGYQIEMA